MWSGSSPRVRGTRLQRLHDRAGQGIIPAYAGNTRGPGRGQRVRRDHPRVCGEHKGTQAILADGEGSSPRVRGTQPLIRPSVRCPGIIPACAGNTMAAATWRTRRRDHPRVCGEHGTLHGKATEAAGSSPRVRGTPRDNTIMFAMYGIIPACAGNTACFPGSSRAFRDHPRVCGEHSGLSKSGEPW